MDPSIDRERVITRIEQALGKAEPGFGTFFLARFLRPGRRIVHLESRMYDTAGRLAAFAAGAWHRLETGERQG
jgi:hypothetical protein